MPSKRAIDELGGRLKLSGPISTDDLRQIAEHRATHAPALTEVYVTARSAVLTVGRIAISGRLKNTQTIVDKLQSSSMRLSQMQDIAGIRLVLKEGRKEQQDLVVEALQKAFGTKIVRVKDRRKDPRMGYRAVHLIANVGCFAEIQVRTRPQHLWAQSFERLADYFGRDLRYRHINTNDKFLTVRGIDLELEDVVQTFLQSSQSIHEAESYLTIDPSVEAELSSIAKESIGIVRQVIGATPSLPADIPHDDLPLEAGESWAAAIVLYNRATGETIEVVTGPPKEIEKRWYELEMGCSRNLDIEVVMLVADNWTDMETVHARYFLKSAKFAGG